MRVQPWIGYLFSINMMTQFDFAYNDAIKFMRNIQ